MIKPPKDIGLLSKWKIKQSKQDSIIHLSAENTIHTERFTQAERMKILYINNDENSTFSNLFTSDKPAEQHEHYHMVELASKDIHRAPTVYIVLEPTWDALQE